MPNPEMPEFITIESAIAALVDVLEHTPPEDRPEPWTVFLAVAEGYGESVDLTFKPASLGSPH